MAVSVGVTWGYLGAQDLWISTPGDWAFPVVWTTTDAIRQGKWALGMAEVTAEQQAAIATDNTIHTFDLASERFQRFQDPPAGRRTGEYISASPGD